MALNAFLKIEGIDGESTEQGHEKCLELLQYSFGLSQPQVMTGGAGARTAGRADFESFRIRKMMDKASPNLAGHCASGKHIPKITLDVHMASEQKTKFASVVMENVIVSSVHTVGEQAGTTPRPEEEVGFAFGKITWEYTPVDNLGKPGGPVKAGWDIEKNVKV